MKILHSLQTSSDQKTLQIQNLNSEANKNLETISYSQKQLQTLTDKLSDSQKELQTTRKNLTNAQKQFQTIQDKLTNSLEQHKTTKNELSISQKQLQTNKEQLTNLPKQLQSTKDKLDKSKKELQSTKDKLTESQKQTQMTKDKLDILTDTSKQLQSTKDKLVDYQKQLLTTKETLAESQKQVQNLNKENKKNGENLAKYKIQVQQKSDALLQCETDFKITKDKLLDSQNQLKTLSDNVESKILEKSQKLNFIQKEMDKKTVTSPTQLQTPKDNSSSSQIQSQTTKDKLPDPSLQLNSHISSSQITLSSSQIQSQTTKVNPPDQIPQLTIDIYPTYSDKDRSPTSSHLHTKNFKNHVLRITKIGIFSWKHHGEGWESMVNSKNGQIINAKTFELSCILCDFVLAGNRTDRTGPIEDGRWSYRKDGVKKPTYCDSTYF